MRYFYSVPPEDGSHSWYELFYSDNEGRMHSVALFRSEDSAKNIVTILNDRIMDEQLKAIQKGQ